MNTCKDCKFWVPWKDTNINRGDCRVRSPQVVANVSSSTSGDGERELVFTQFDSYWPDTAPDEWCGEWKGKA